MSEIKTGLEYEKKTESSSVLDRIAVTGIKPSGTPHIGNYLGMIRPALELVGSYRTFYFIADNHSLTTSPACEFLRKWSLQAAAAWMALGLDPTRVVFYRQSDVPEIFELQWILACVTSKGLLNRAHAYKAAVEANTLEGRPSHANINAGLFNYPILMAADILLFGAEVVPVGEDQRQHLEIVRDIAGAFNLRYGSFFRMPEALTLETTMTVPGIDGRKMSKSYRNDIPIFADSDEIHRRVMRIVTDSKGPGEPKNPDHCHGFAIYRHFAPPEAVETWRRRHENGGAAYVDIKSELADLLDCRFRKQRRTYHALLEDTRGIERILARGAGVARAAAGPMLKRVRHMVGIG
jgi:tryptophanyl-tRNA synthetase